MTATSDPAAWPCLRATPDGATVLDVLVAPNARRTVCMGLHGGALRIRLAAAPVDGAANDALLRWVGGQLDVPRQAVTLERGCTARRKQLRVAVPPARVAAWLATASFADGGA